MNKYCIAVYFHYLHQWGYVFTHTTLQTGAPYGNWQDKKWNRRRIFWNWSDDSELSERASVHLSCIADAFIEPDNARKAGKSEKQ